MSSPHRNRAASFSASTFPLLLPSFNRSLRRGLQTKILFTRGLSAPYRQGRRQQFVWHGSLEMWAEPWHDDPVIRQSSRSIWLTLG
jgi:hypothetical protein